jgi:pyruvate dehydrogenase E2 component (dihydrolipoamide acetyltransferase)
MADTVSMPKLGFDMAEGNLVRWLKKVNDPVEKGQVLAEIETDKATVEVESPYSGVVLQLVVEEGTSVPIGSPIAMIGAAGEKLESSTTIQAIVANVFPEVKAKVAEVTAEAKAEKETMVSLSTLRPSSSESISASPLARHLAKEQNIDLTNVIGTGPSGRIVRKDVELAIKSTSQDQSKNVSSLSFNKISRPGSIPEDKRLPMSKLRSAIGRRMLDAKQTVPHFYLTTDVDVERMLDLRNQLNSILPDEQKISVNDFIIKAVGLALRQYPKLNSSISGNEIIQHGHIHIGVAVSVDGGLLTIVVRDADIKDLREINNEVKEMANRVRSGKVKTEDIEGSTFSISNLGMFDVENFAAIINPPESAILAVASARDAVVIKNGVVSSGKRMKITISADHRVTDGVEAAKFIQVVKQIIETPVQMLVS